MLKDALFTLFAGVSNHPILVRQSPFNTSRSPILLAATLHTRLRFYYIPRTKMANQQGRKVSYRGAWLLLLGSVGATDFLGRDLYPILDAIYSPNNLHTQFEIPLTIRNHPTYCFFLVPPFRRGGGQISWVFVSERGGGTKGIHARARDFSSIYLSLFSSHNTTWEPEENFSVVRCNSQQRLWDAK